MLLIYLHRLATTVRNICSNLFHINRLDHQNDSVYLNLNLLQHNFFAVSESMPDQHNSQSIGQGNLTSQKEYRILCPNSL